MSENHEDDNPADPKDGSRSIDELMMEVTSQWREDPRSVDELILAAMCEQDEDLAWDAVVVLHWRGSREILDRALSLCGSACAFERRVGAEILGQLGVPERSFPEECLRTLLRMLEMEQDAVALRAILIALSHHDEIEAIDAALRFRNHVDDDLRHGVVVVLMGHNEPRAIEGLIELTRDSDVRVRDWATFGLGSQTDADTPELRAALLDRLSDEDGTTREEAMVGLAARKDPRVLPILRDELVHEDGVGTLAVEAAGLIAEPSLLPLLLPLREWWDVEPETLEDAIQACSPKSDASDNQD